MDSRVTRWQHSISRLSHATCDADSLDQNPELLQALTPLIQNQGDCVCGVLLQTPDRLLK